MAWDRFEPDKLLFKVQAYLIENIPLWIEQAVIWAGEGIIWAAGELMALIGQFFEFLFDKGKKVFYFYLFYVFYPFFFRLKIRCWFGNLMPFIKGVIT